MDREKTLDRAWDALATRPGGLSSRYWAHYADLTPSQLTAAKAFARELFEEENFWVKLYVGGEWIYRHRAHASEKDIFEDRERQLNTQVTRARREHGDWHKVAAANPDNADYAWQEELARQRLAHLKHALANWQG